MCDFFWPRVEGNRGELADVVRSGSQSSSQVEPVAGAEEQIAFPSSRSLNDNSTDFGVEDPNLFHLPLEFLDVGGEQERMNRPCDDLLRVLQISPGAGAGETRVLRPSPLVVLDMAGAPLDHGGGLEISSPRAQGIKRRKSQTKRVVCIPAPVVAVTGRPGGGGSEVVPSDLWAWRKYGQKPIKGSPHPRGYYRCSSSKGCSARKQVERSRTDPNMLVITYTSEHNHPWPTQRNAFAGSTRCHTTKHPKPTPLPKEEPADLVKEEALLIESTTTNEEDKAIMEDQVAEEEDDFILTTNNQISHKRTTTTTTAINDLFDELVGFEEGAGPTSRTLGMEGNSRGDKGLMDMFDWSEALELSNKKY